MWLIRSFHLLTVIASGINAITVNPPNPLKDGTFTLTATATGATLTWVKDSMTLTACFVAANTCAFPTPSSMPNAVITIDSVTSVSTITISNATQALNGGVYEATNALSRTVIVSTLPSSVQWESQPVNGSSLTTGTWIAKTPCVFSETSINIEFTIFVDGVQHSMQRVSTYYESDACEAPEKMVLAKLVLDSDSYFNKRVYIVANASHNLFPSEPYVESVPSNEVIFEGVHASTPKPTTKPLPDQKCFWGYHTKNTCESITIGIAFGIVGAIIGCIVFICKTLYRKRNNRHKTILQSTPPSNGLDNHQTEPNIFTDSSNETENSIPESEIRMQHWKENSEGRENINSGKNDTSRNDAAEDN